jgi:hypothetical protein
MALQDSTITRVHHFYVCPVYHKKHFPFSDYYEINTNVKIEFCEISGRRFSVRKALILLTPVV